MPSMQAVTQADHEWLPQLLANLSGPDFDWFADRILAESSAFVADEIKSFDINDRTGEISQSSDGNLVSLLPHGEFSKACLELCPSVYDQLDEALAVSWLKRGWLRQCENDGQTFAATAVPAHNDDGVGSYCERLLIVIKAPAGRKLRCFDADWEVSEGAVHRATNKDLELKTGDVIRFNESFYHQLIWTEAVRPDFEDDDEVPVNELCWFINVPSPTYEDA